MCWSVYNCSLKILINQWQETPSHVDTNSNLNTANKITISYFRTSSSEEEEEEVETLSYMLASSKTPLHEFDIEAECSRAPNYLNC